MHVALLLSSITGIVLSFILFFFNKGYKTANRYLAGFFFFISLFILSQYSGLYGQSEVLAAIFASAPTPFVFLIGPLSFFYIRSVLRDHSGLSKADAFHFLLFLLEFIGMIPYFFSSWEYKLEVARVLLSDDWHVTHLSLNKIFVSPINSFLRPLHILAYMGLGWYLMLSYYRKPMRSFTPLAQTRLVKKWLFIFISVFTAFTVCYCLLTVNLLIYSSKQLFQANSTALLLAGSVSVLALNIFTLLFPQILYGLPRIIRLVPQPTDTNQPQSIKEAIPETTAPTTVSVEEEGDAHMENEIAEKLAELYKNKQPWTDKNFSIATLAIQLHVPEHHLRYYFNHGLQVSFSEHRNQLRVEHAKQLLQDDTLHHLSIEGIGAQAGFSSKSTFFAVFKKATGQTPKEFLEQYQKKDSDN